MVEKSPKALMVVARDLRSSISGTENVVFVGAEAGRALADVDQPIFVAIDERPQQHAADDAEDGGVGADAERERDDDGEREALGAQQRAQRDAHVLSKRLGRVEPAAAPDAPHRLARQRDVAELPQRGETRGVGILAAIDALLDAEREVAADLVVEVALVGAHALLLARRRRIHDAADGVDELRPAILLARRAAPCRPPSAGSTSRAGSPR